LCARPPARRPPRLARGCKHRPLAPAAVIVPAKRSAICSCHGPDGNPITKDYPILKGSSAIIWWRHSARIALPSAPRRQRAGDVRDGEEPDRREIAELADWFAMVRR
jgi:hypothetical protein